MKHYGIRQTVGMSLCSQDVKVRYSVHYECATICGEGTVPVCGLECLGSY